MKYNYDSLSRRALLGVFAATAVTAAPAFSKAAGFLRGAGNIRRIRMHSDKTGESVDTIYWIEGEYIRDVAKELNYFMRDWRTGAVRAMDMRAIDIMAAANNIMGTREPYILLSGYRTAKTNAMLRSRSQEVARNSLHMKGMAVDVRMKSRSVRQMARAAAACKAGGVGRYSKSNFVHMDCGRVRVWGS